MKKNILTILVFFIALQSFSQDVNVIDKVAKKTCKYLESLDLNTLSKSERNMKLGLYIFKMYDEFKTEFNKEGIYFDPSKGKDEGRKFGIKIGTNMTKFCPKILISLAGKEMDKKENMNFSIKGELKNITGKEISVISILDENGKTQKFVWLNNFEGSDKLITSENIEGLRVKITYGNIEIYSPQLKEYIVKKQVSKIEYIE